MGSEYNNRDAILSDHLQAMTDYLPETVKFVQADAKVNMPMIPTIRPKQVNYKDQEDGNRILNNTPKSYGSTVRFSN